MSPKPPDLVEFWTADLLSKWGFSDGDQLSWLDEFGIKHDQAVLCAVVRQKILPLLKQKVEVLEMGTCHNPIRASSVDGLNVQDLWYLPDSDKPVLFPLSVVLTGEEILEIARKVPKPISD